MFEVLITSSVLILALALLRRLWKGRISPVFQYALWFIVAVRLLVPVPVSGNAFSVMNVAERMARGAEKWAEEREEEIRRDSPGRKNETLSYGSAGIEENQAGFLSENRQPNDGEKKETEAQHASAGAEGFGVEQAGADGAKPQDAAQGVLAGFSLTKLLQYIWYTGILLMAAGMLCGNIRFRRRLCRERRLIGQRDGIRIYAADSLESPCLYGVLRPSVYLNPACLMSKRRREHAIVHELTHYRHGDHIWILARSLCALLYWFDPLVWMAVRLCARDCEMACDAGAIRRLGEGQRESYGRTLIELACYPAGRVHLLRCATDLSCGKKDLKERITMIAAAKKRKRPAAVLAALCGVCLAACTFGGAKEVGNRGAYVEEAFEGDITISNGSYLVQDGEKVRLASYLIPNEWLSADGGNSFSKEEAVEAGRGVYVFSVAADGARIFARTEQDGDGRQYTWHLVSGDGLASNPEPPEGSDEVSFYYGAGYFYAVNEYGGRYTIYQVDPSNGGLKSLTELSSPVFCLAASEDMLCVLQAEGMLLYDLKKGDIAEKQDTLLSDYLASAADTFGPGLYRVKACLYLRDNWLYILTRGGLVRHELYGESFERVIDGSMCGIGDSGHYFSGMAINGEVGEEEFLILFSDRKLARYRYDPEAETDTEVLRVYTAYEDTDVRKLVAAFRGEHPEIQIKYEVGVSPEYGGTYEDALRGLATELAAGTGPDILFVDELPYLSYVEKGALLDLSDIREEMTQDMYFTKIIDGMETDGKLYAIPLSFVIPVWGGRADLLEAAGDVNGLEEWADLLEKVTAQEPDGGGLGILNEADLFSLLAMTSMGEWVSGDSLDWARMEEFLVQAKRICDMQKAALQKDGYWGSSMGVESDDENRVTRQMGFNLEVSTEIYLGFMLYPGQAFWAGYLNDSYEYLSNYMKYGEYGFRQMPGQSPGKCLPLSMMAVNSNSAHMEASRLFLEYALSVKYQRGADMFGFPVNREAFEKRQTDHPQGTDLGSIQMGSYHSEEKEYLNLRWPNEESFGKLNELAEDIGGINICEYQVYRVIAEEALKALKGECGIGEALAAMEQKLSVYMAE